jgi:hypothetical protein
MKKQIERTAPGVRFGGSKKTIYFGEIVHDTSNRNEKEPSNPTLRLRHGEASSSSRHADHLAGCLGESPG